MVTIVMSGMEKYEFRRGASELFEVLVILLHILVCPSVLFDAVHLVREYVLEVSMTVTGDPIKLSLNIT